MKLEIDMPEHHYNNIIAFDSVSLGRVPYKGIIMYAINAIKRGKALEQEPTTKNDLGVDAVSRKAVINQIFYSTDNNGDVVLGSALRERIARLPSVTPQEPRWIPVSERLPNLDDFTGSKVWQKKVLITGYLSFDDTKDLFVSEAFAKDVICNSVHDTVVIAWMPLPKAYREVEE